MPTQSKSGQAGEVAQKHHEKQPDDLCHLQCGTIVQERNRYYTGKYMTARDFELEQDYMLSHHRLHNRLLHGWGIVCGLQVTPHTQPDCNDSYVVVSPGVAIDCCGRELVLRHKMVVKVWNPDAEKPSDHEVDEAREKYREAHERWVQEEQEARKHFEEAQESELNEFKEREGDERRRFERDQQLDRQRFFEHNRDQAERERFLHGQEEERERFNAEEEQERKRFEDRQRVDAEEFEKRRKHERPAIVKHGGPFLIVLRYDEEGIEWTPALYSEQACDPRQLEANRVCEVAKIDVLRWDENEHSACWPLPHKHKKHEPIPCQDDCDQPVPGDSPSCVDPVCECKYGVPLARVSPALLLDRDNLDQAPHWEISARWIDKRGRHEISTPRGLLTHIVYYNWEHGGVIKLSELSDPKKMNRRLKIYFDRPLWDDPDDKGIGVNRYTFVVTYDRPEDIHYNVETLFTDGDGPYVERDEEGCCAVFPIARESLTGQANIGRAILHVTLKCDFVLDCHQHPVDGEHLGGVTPTGDGRPGGTFESWFRIEDDMADRDGRRHSEEGKRPIVGKS